MGWIGLWTRSSTMTSYGLSLPHAIRPAVEGRIALTLRLVCGLTTAEIARAGIPGPNAIWGRPAIVKADEFLENQRSQTEPLHHPIRDQETTYMI